MSEKDLYEQAFEEYHSGNTESAVKKLLVSANSGNVSAMELLALFYSGDENENYDLEKSAYWDMKAIESGSTVSLINLAITYRMRGNIREAKKWFGKAIEAGDGEAVLDLAKLYMVSEREKDTVKVLLEKVIIHSDINNKDYDMLYLLVI